MSADLAIKEPCLVATSANITLSGLQTIDGVTVAAGDRILVKAQTTASQNGIYTAASGAWSRATDFDVSSEAIGGTQVLVTSGTLNAGSSWRIAGSATITLGSTSIAFERAVDSDSVAFLQRGPGAEIRGAEAKMGDFFNLLDFHDAANGANITDALEAVIYDAAPGLVSIQIFIPEGRFVVSRQIIPARPITLRGAGMYASELVFQNLATANTTLLGAFGIANGGTYDPAMSSKAGNGSGSASFSVFQDLAIEIDGTRPTGLDYGIWTAGRVFATNVRFVNCGVKVRAGGPTVGSGAITGNANNCVFQNCISSYSPEHGFIFEGTDANACAIVGCTAYGAQQFGFYDASLLGNSYVGCCADGGGISAVSAYVHRNVIGTNSSLFSGCYAESNFAGDIWDIQTGGLILQPLGILPEPVGTLGNPTFASIESSGLWGNLPLTVTPSKQNAFTVGDATNHAARYQAEGLYIRDRNGNLAQFTAEAGGTMLLKANFPVHANNAAAAGAGLAVDSVYSTATGELRVVV
ncbi:MAG: hypothetical protein QOD42_2059 [Sphingomonadales bacterium]|jgi:hypothetical protein|nr:hypothetical protein [Sphingomonadales bacterium]